MDRSLPPRGGWYPGTDPYRELQQNDNNIPAGVRRPRIRFPFPNRLDGRSGRRLETAQGEPRAQSDDTSIGSPLWRLEHSVSRSISTISGGWSTIADFNLLPRPLSDLRVRWQKLHHILWLTFSGSIDLACRSFKR